MRRTNRDDAQAREALVDELAHDADAVLAALEQLLAGEAAADADEAVEPEGQGS